jgi:Leucine-rich repeat (LRR) protein
VRYTAVNRGGVTALQNAIPALRIDFLDTAAAPIQSRRKKPPATGTAATLAAWIRSLGGTAVVQQGHIVEISLASTQATDADLVHLKGLSRLRKLNLRGTQAGDLGLRNLGLERCALTDLELGNTTVSDVGLDAVASCVNLRRLGLGYTLVQGDGLAKLATPGTLIDLDFKGNGLSENGAEAIAHLRKLQRLDLSYSDVADKHLASLANLENLTYLDLTATDIGDEALAALRPLRNLSELMLNYGRFTERGLKSLQALTRLTRLELVHTRTTDGALEALSALKNLSRLNLDYTAVTEKSLPYLAAMQSLTDLSLDTAAITDAGIESLKSFRQLRRLNLYHTFATENAVESLKKALPECRVTWDRGSNLPIRRGS